ncbi:hypothetical protein L484_011740 [Morus notabilis]|uniref:Uncharacterized protein n=1 Tax=Morus notabilis TaxID=981085 RepID=W9SAZ1_9ROSA|nr:hypothetical protein L484_011740 [Morus notabilis]
MEVPIGIQHTQELSSTDKVNQRALQNIRFNLNHLDFMIKEINQRINTIRKEFRGLVDFM